MKYHYLVILLLLFFIPTSHGQDNARLKTLVYKKQKLIDQIKKQSALADLTARIEKILESIRPQLNPLVQEMNVLLKDPQIHAVDIKHLQHQIEVIKANAKDQDGKSLLMLEHELRQAQKNVREKIKTETGPIDQEIKQFKQ